MKGLVVFVAVYLAFPVHCSGGAEPTSWPAPPPSNDTEPGGTLDYGWAIRDEIDDRHCRTSRGFNTISNSGQEHFATVSYYIAQGYALPTPIRSPFLIKLPKVSIRAPVPCLSTITVTSAMTGASIVARITRVCRNCRNKHIGLSPAAFAKLLPGKRPGSNSSTAELKIWWSIDILRSGAEGNGPPTSNRTENIYQIDRKSVV